MKHIISALVQNKPGVLAHVAGMFAARAFNIDSLAVGRTDEPALSRMTIVVIGDDKVVEQVRKQLEKIIDVVKVQDFAIKDVIAHDLMLMCVHAPPEKRHEILALVEMFKAKVVDIGQRFVMVELADSEEKLEAFIEACRPYGIKNLARTGTVAMAAFERTEIADNQ
ncbi:MAG: acetolactate synthase small subunit [Sedimentisphaerales bacterium]